MITIQLNNPSINEYIQAVGKEKIEEMISTYLEIKAKFYNSSKKEENSEPLYKQFGISEKLHNRLLALKPISSKKTTKMGLLRNEISNKFKDGYSNKSIKEIRDEYFYAKEYL